jgi:carboxyl-terminal processing protease
MPKNFREKLLVTLPFVFGLTLQTCLTAARSADVVAQAPPVTQARIAQVGQPETVAPERLFQFVYRLIRSEYFDQTFNGQDWSYWEARYKGKLKTVDDAHKAIETMLSSLGDKYTRFLDRDAFEDEKQQIDARLFGVGIQIGLDKSQRVIVIAPLEDTPADKAGVLPGDEIAEINGTSTKGSTVEEAAKAIKGPKGTPVELTLISKGVRRKVKMMRDEIQIASVQSAKMLDEKIGYIRLSTFISHKANEEMQKALIKLSSAKGLVLDLRDNPGGLLNNAIDISNMFLAGHNTIVSTVDKDGYKSPSWSDGKPISQQHLVVLINRGSASASEIASGALKDNGRAILVGQRTFGKGLVQGIRRLEDHSGVNYTIAQYLTPNDTDIHNKGISPDILVDLTEDDQVQGRGPWWLDPNGPAAERKPDDLKDIQLKKAVEILRERVQGPVVVGKATSEGSSTPTHQ